MYDVDGTLLLSHQDHNSTLACALRLMHVRVALCSRHPMSGRCRRQRLVRQPRCRHLSAQRSGWPSCARARWSQWNVRASGVEAAIADLFLACSVTSLAVCRISSSRGDQIYLWSAADDGARVWDMVRISRAALAFADLRCRLSLRRAATRFRTRTSAPCIRCCLWAAQCGLARATASCTSGTQRCGSPLLPLID